MFFLCAAGPGIPLAAAVEVMPSGIVCCDEFKIRLAMTEEALARIMAKAEPARQGGEQAGDYLSAQSYEKIKKHLPPAGNPGQLLAFLREALQRPAPDADIREFQTLVGHFVMGMTLEIGGTFQDEFDRASVCRVKMEKLLAELAKSPRPDRETLERALAQADLPERELRRIRARAKKWKSPPAGSPPLIEFSALKKNITGRAAGPDLWFVFELAERYRPRFAFLDEFLENYRRLAADFREAAHRLNERLTFIGQ